MQLSGNKSLLIAPTPACGSGMCAPECGHISHCVSEHVGSTGSKGACWSDTEEDEEVVLQNPMESRSRRDFLG